MRKGSGIDLTGRTFGQWTVIRIADNDRFGNRRWECRCLCERVFNVQGTNLTGGISTRCRFCCPLGLIDLSGKKIGEWTVIKRAYSKETGAIMWECQCSCGFISIVEGTSLNKGESTRCKDCYGVSTRRPPGYAGKQVYLRSYRNGAKSRSIAWQLTDELALSLAVLDCYYCGTPPGNLIKGRTKKSNENGKFLSNGIDRKYNSIGYTIENSVACCKTCNFAKHALTLEAWNQWLDRIIAFRTSK